MPWPPIHEADGRSLDRVVKAAAVFLIAQSPLAASSVIFSPESLYVWRVAKVSEQKEHEHCDIKTHICVHTYMNTRATCRGCSHTQKHRYMYVYMYMFMRSRIVHLKSTIFLCAYTNTHTRVCVCVCACVRVCVRRASCIHNNLRGT